MKENEMGGSCKTHAREKKFMQVLTAVPDENRLLGTPGCRFFFSMALTALTGPCPLLQFRN
jgi:hypothetical protein